jgi:hypothetical protein
VRKATIIVAAIAFLAGISAAGGTPAKRTVPDVLLLESLSKVYEPVRLDHAEHISTAGHRIDPSVFKKNVNAGTLKPCGECHAVSNRPGDRGRLELKAAYHQACFKCHKDEVEGNPKGCTGLCHVPKAERNREGKK